eukprot:m.1229055 g.1229055  ORF g.1229055 m.1229055 type:complete len:550 (+) comp24649_c0_seq26:194-1843(+)
MAHLVDDDFGDLSSVMGDDGGDWDDGDPNIKPRVAPAAVQVEGSATQESVTVKFPAQKQCLSKLVVECMPASCIPGFNASKMKGDPFDHYTSTAGFIVQPTDPINARTATFEGLAPGQAYFTRLVCTNPSGTTRGKCSEALYTLPQVPPAPLLGYATSQSVCIKFPKQGKGITKLSIEMALWCADPFGPQNKKRGMLSDEGPHIGERSSGLVRNLRPGTPYVFRLITTNAGGNAIGPMSKPIKTIPKPPPAPLEDVTGRKDTEISLKWKPVGQDCIKLQLEYAILSGKGTFNKLKENGGRTITIGNAQEATGYVVKNLKPNTNYIFRLVQFNSSGSANGALLGPIKTVSFSPDMLDQSGWLYEAAIGKELARTGTIKRRSSKSKFPKYWYTLDGKLLSWFKDVDGEEINYLHLGKTETIESKDDMVILTLKNKKQMLKLRAFSDNPNEEASTIAQKWCDRLNAAKEGRLDASKAAAASDADTSTASITEVVADEEEHATGDEADGEGFEEDENFQEAAFGEESEEDDDDFGGGFGEEEDEEEEEDSFGF